MRCVTVRQIQVYRTNYTTKHSTFQHSETNLSNNADPILMQQVIFDIEKARWF